MSIESFYEYPAGVALSKFFEGLTRMKIVASQCSICKTLTIPPRAYCLKCYKPVEKYPEVEGVGQIATYTRSFINIDGELKDKPTTWVFVKFDGIEGGLVHILDPSIPPRTGLRVRPVFRERTIGSILDIKWFTAVE